MERHPLPGGFEQRIRLRKARRELFSAQWLLHYDCDTDSEVFDDLLERTAVAVAEIARCVSGDEEPDA